MNAFYIMCAVIMAYVSVSLGISMKMQSIKTLSKYQGLAFCWPILYFGAFLALLAYKDVKSKKRVIKLFIFRCKLAIMLCMYAIATAISNLENELTTDLDAHSIVSYENEISDRGTSKRKRSNESSKRSLGVVATAARKHLIVALSL